jgi:hypothetical protein
VNNFEKLNFAVRELKANGTIKRDSEMAAALAGHTSTVITMNHYATGEKKRQDERLKKVGNKFA